jgi:4-amino-4-deoxy-L-arabinose transferase-like glycosyltransferase
MERAMPWRREPVFWSLAIFALALLLRGLHLWQLQGSPQFEMLVGDARSYDAWARRIAAGDWLGSEVFYQAPLYPYFLAGIYRWFSDDPLAARAVQSLLGGGACVLLGLAGRRFFSPAAGAAAGLLLALYAPAIFADTALQKSALDLFLLCLCLWVLARLGEAPHRAPGACLALGLSFGALSLTRENALVFLVALAPWLLWPAAGAGGWRRWAPVALLAAGAGLVLLPVALRNQWVGGEFHLTTSQLGPNLFIGNNRVADGTYTPLLQGRGDAQYERGDATSEAEKALGRKLTPGEVSRYYVGRVLAYIGDEPGDWLRLMARKLVLALNAVEIMDTEDLYTGAESSLPLRASAWLFHFGVLAPLAAVGLWGTRSQWRRLLPLYLLSGSYLGTLVAFYVFGRYRLPLAVLLAPFAGVGLVHLAGSWRGGGRPAWRPALALGALVVFCNWPVIDRDHMRSVAHYNLGTALYPADLRAAEAQFREAIRLDEGNVQARNNLGAILSIQGDIAGARQQFERALRDYPMYLDARLNLARSLRQGGDRRAAVEHYEVALRLAPGRAEVQRELGEVYAELGAQARSQP